MEQNVELKSLVKKKYSEIVKDDNSCCCGPASNKLETDCSMAEDYTSLEGYNPEADYSLGCGVPTRHAEISAGDTVLDLGAGAGNDVFIVEKIVGESGFVIGLDFTQDMVDKAQQNKAKLGLTNVDFKLGDIEDMPIESASTDVVISNCVLNLVPNKEKAFQEMYRVLKPGAHFCVSDIVSEGTIPEELKKSAELYAGCVAGAIPKEEYLGLVKQAGFENLDIRKERSIEIPKETAKQHLSEDEWISWENGSVGLYSITLYAKKPLAD